VADAGGGRAVDVYLGDGKKGSPIASNASAQEVAVHAAAEEAAARGVTQVIIKAERTVHFRDVSRLIRAAALPQVSVSLAVEELD
jgi:hypothetical protein